MQLQQQLEELAEVKADVKVQLEKTNLLLADANMRLDSREEELMSMEENLLRYFANLKKIGGFLNILTCC